MNYKIKDSGIRDELESGAVRDIRDGKGRFDLLPPQIMRALAIHYEIGANKYAERNWEKGISISRYFDSALRHIFDVMDGLNDENHLMSAIWNLVCAYETILRIQQEKLPKGLYDLPNKIILPSVYKEEK